MTFRDDLAAVNAKNDALTEDNERLREKLEGAIVRAEEADDLHARIEALESANRRHERGLWTKIVRNAVILAIIGVPIVTVLGYFAYQHTEGAEQELWQMREEAERRDMELMRAGEQAGRAEEERARAHQMNTERDRGFGTLRRVGHVTEVSGAAPVAAGSECAVDVYEGAGEYNCRVEVRCDGQLIYGGGRWGFLTCAIVEGRPTTGRDIRGSAGEGDPMIELDLPGDRVVVRDAPTPDFAVTITLEGAPRPSSSSLVDD